MKCKPNIYDYRCKFCKVKGFYNICPVKGKGI